MNILFLLLLSLASFGQSELTSDEKTLFDKGQLVKRVKTLEGKVWPQVTIISVIPHTPRENMEVFADYETQKDFMPDILTSKILKQVSPEEAHVKFVMNMPWPIANSEYVTRNIVEYKGDSAQLRWTLIKANQMKATEGLVDFKPYGDGQSYFSYTTHITPDSALAGLLKGRVVTDVEKAVVIIIKHLDKTIKKKKASAPTPAPAN